jgi:ribulose-phosphate 3-epimerase
MMSAIYEEIIGLTPFKMITQHIIPAIIPDSLEHLESRLSEMRGAVKRVQVDVMDGTYTKNTSWPYSGVQKEAFEAIRREDEGLPYWQEFDFEIDLLLEKPEKRIDEWALAGAACLIVHVESTDKLDDIASECNNRRIEMALALKPSTDIQKLSSQIERALFVQVMGNDRIGYHGVTLDKKVLDKIREIKKQWPHSEVGVDIGVNTETLPQLIEAGAERFACGSAVFNFTDPSSAIVHLENIVSTHTKTS